MTAINVKELKILPISAKDANAFVQKVHYSGKAVPNSQIHFGVFFNNNMGGVLQFGPSMVKKNIIHLVKNTGWNDFIELNRMAFADWLPKNYESRAISVCLRLLKKNFPHLKWVITFADATQCGDGTIYRATNALLTGIKKNTGLRKNKVTGEILQQIAAHHRKIAREFTSSGLWVPLEGFQIRYIWLLDKTCELNCEQLNYEEIAKAGAKMKRGVSGI